ncbi:MAG: Spy/CpxP family protein refolding chaperone [Thermoanaerobaculia bacterium]
MKNSKKWMTAAAVLALSTSMAFAAPHEGKGGKHRRGGRGGEFGERLAQKLKLTDAQKQQIRDLQKSFREENKAFFQQTRDTRRQMREAKETGDQARLESLKATAKSQHEQMRALRTQQRERITSLLTSEQRAQLDALKAERKERRGKR